MIQPREDLPKSVETPEEATDELDTMVERINRLRVEIQEGFAQDSSVDDYLAAAALALREANSRVAELETRMSREGQARAIAKTALRRYADIDEGGALGGDAEDNLDGSIDELIAALRKYAKSDTVDPQEALIALERCEKLLDSD